MTQLLDLTEVARRLHVSRTTVWQLRKSGELPTVHIGQHAFVTEDDLDAYIISKKEVA